MMPLPLHLLAPLFLVDIWYGGAWGALNENKHHQSENLLCSSMWLQYFLFFCCRKIANFCYIEANGKYFEVFSIFFCAAILYG